MTRMFASGLRETVTLRGAGSKAAHFVDILLEASEEFRAAWELHEIGLSARPRRSAA